MLTESGNSYNFDFVQVANFYVDGFWGKVGTPRRDALEAFITKTKGMDHESEEFLRLQAEFHIDNFVLLEKS